MISLGGDILKHYKENVWIQFSTFVFTKVIVIVIATIKLTTAIVTQGKIVGISFLWTETFNNFNCRPEERSWSILLQGLHRRQWRWGHKKVFYLRIVIILTVVIYLLPEYLVDQYIVDNCQEVLILSSPRAKGPRAESARAVTGRRCPHSGVG